MTCLELEKLLDLLEKGQTLQEEALVHAASCPRCALALHLEGVLASAPQWAARERMTIERRAAVLARARTGSFVTPGMAEALQESVLNALVALALVSAAVLFAPSHLRTLLPPAVYDVLGTLSAPLIAAVEPVTKPLLATPLGTLSLLAAGFSFCFAAAFSARMMAQARQS